MLIAYMCGLFGVYIIVIDMFVIYVVYQLLLNHSFADLEFTGLLYWLTLLAYFTGLLYWPVTNYWPRCQLLAQ